MDGGSWPPHSEGERGPAPVPGASDIPPPPIDVSTDQVVVPQPPPPKTSVLKRVLVALGAFAVVAGIGALAFVFIALRGTGDVIDRMVPSNSSVYVTIYLDPALKQKLNLRNLVKHFPNLADSAALDRRIDEALNQVLQGSGLTAKDIRPWVGSQVAFVLTFDGDKAQAVVLIASKDDEMARAALARIRTGPGGRRDTWKEETHGGIVVSVSSLGGKPDGAYTVLDHTALVGDQAAIDAVIDTSQGKGSSIGESVAFAKTVATLPTERLALAYVDFPSLIARFKTEIQKGGVDLSGLSNSFGQLDAFTGLGATLSAQPNGVALDVSIAMDRTKLTAEQKQVVAGAPHQNAALSFTPKDAYGLVVGTDLRQTIQAALDQFEKSDPTGSAMIDAATGLSGVIPHLSGDYGIEVSPGVVFPEGALFLATDDESRMQRFLDRFAGLVLEGQLGGVTGTIQHQTYKGVDIAYVRAGQLETVGVTPAYAVTQGTAVVASSIEEVKAIIDAKGNGTNVTSAPNLLAAATPDELSNNGMLYLDVEAILRDVRRVLGPAGQAQFDAAVGSSLDPLKAFILTNRNAPDRTTIRMFFLIR